MRKRNRIRGRRVIQRGKRREHVKHKLHTPPLALGRSVGKRGKIEGKAERKRRRKSKRKRRKSRPTEHWL